MRTSIVLLVIALARAAAADPASDAATHAAAGKKAFAENKFTEAIAEFRIANQLQPDPKLLYAIAQAQRMAGDCAAAIATYEDFIKTRASQPDTDKLVEYSQANITRCKEQLAAAPKKDPAPVPVPVPVKDPPPVKDPSPPAKDPAPTTVASVPGPTSPELPPRDTGGGGWKTDVVGHVLVGGGVAASVIGLVVWSGARSKAQDVEGATDYNSFIERSKAADGAVGKQRLGIGLAVLGIGAVGVGVWHYTTASGKKKEVRVTATPGGGAITAKVSF